MVEKFCVYEHGFQIFHCFIVNAMKIKELDADKNNSYERILLDVSASIRKYNSMSDFFNSHHLAL